MGELQVSSLEQVYKMTWREFQLRLMAYKRMQENKQLLARQMTYMAGYALHTQKPKPIEQFWQVGEKKKITDDVRERMKQAITKARAKVKNK